MSLDREFSRQHTRNENGFRDVMNILKSPVRLNLGDDFRQYIVDQQFNAQVNSLVADPLTQIWSDLQSLDLAQTAVVDLSAIPALVNLEMLDLSETQVTDISSLSQITNLRWLDMTATLVTDISPLYGLTRLEHLFLTGARELDITEFRAVAPLLLDKQASRRYIDNENGFRDEVYASRTNVRRQVRLNLGADFEMYMLDPYLQWRVNNLVQNPLEQIWSDMEILNLCWTRTVDVRPLAGLVNLRELYLKGTDVRDISALRGLPKLRVLNLWATRLTNVTAVSGLPNLRRLILPAPPA